MTEPENTTDQNVEQEQVVQPEEVTSEQTDQPVETEQTALSAETDNQPNLSDDAGVNPQPTEISPEQPDTAYEVNAGAVPVTPSPGAVSDEPQQTDNSERPEDGPQDVSQDPNEVPSEDTNPEV